MSLGVNVSFRGLRELQEKFGKFPQTSREIIGDAILEGAEATAERVQQEAPVKTGTLRDSVSIRYRFPDEAYIFIAEPAHTYAIFVEEGTRPHTIRPISASKLKFEVNGEIVFAPMVHHPGARPDPFMKRGFEAAEPAVKRIFEKATQRLVDSLAL